MPERMHNKARALAAVKGKKTDRPSVLPSIDVAYAAGCAGLSIGSCFRNTELHAKALVQALETHPEIDGLYVNLCLFESHCHNQSNGLYNDGYGLQWYVPENDIGTVKIHEITDLEDDRINLESSLRFGIIETFSKIPAEYKNEYLIVPGITGPYSQLVFMLGLENVLLLMYDDPDGLKDAISKRVKYAVSWLKELAKLGASAVWLGEGAASSSVISPAAYGEFVAPFARQVIEEAKKMGIPCFMHVCGDIRLSVKEILKTNLRAIDIDYMVPMEMIRDLGGKDICIKGNMNPMDLRSNPKEEVFRKACDIYRTVSSPMILGTGCLVAPGTPKENIDALVEASKFIANEG